MLFLKLYIKHKLSFLNYDSQETKIFSPLKTLKFKLCDHMKRHP